MRAGAFVAAAAAMGPLTAAAGCTTQYKNDASTPITLCFRVNGNAPGETLNKTLQPGDSWDVPCPSNQDPAGHGVSNQMYFSTRDWNQCGWDQGCTQNTGTCKHYPWVFGQGTGTNGLWYGAIGTNWDGATSTTPPVGYTGGGFADDNVHYGLGFKCSAYNGTQHPDLKCTVVEGKQNCTPSHPNQGQPSSGVVECDPTTLHLTIFDAPCEHDKYCCPDAKKCLKASSPAQPCAHDASVCGAGEVCCPLTQICVTPAAPCTAEPTCTSSEYCCPEAKHCLTPVVTAKCKSDATCAPGASCSSLTGTCATASGNCTNACKGQTDASWCDSQTGHCAVATGAACGAGKRCAAGSCEEATGMCTQIGGQVCSDTCADPAYCHAGQCQTPSGGNIVVCTAASDCGDGQVCCPVTGICVTAGKVCDPTK